MFIDSVRLKDSQASGASGYDSDAQAFFDVNTGLTTAQETAIDNLIIGLKANGTWTKYQALYPFISNPANVFPTGNAASEGLGEANSISGWNAVGMTRAVNSTDYTNGLYSMQGTTTTTNAVRIEHPLTVQGGEEYDVTFDYKVATDLGGTQGIKLWTGVITSPSEIFISDGQWHTMTVTITTNATTLLMRFYGNYAGGGGNGNVILIDNIKVQKQSDRAIAHKWNLKNPVDTDAGFRIDWAGTLTHDANGVTGDGSSGYGTTNYVWNTEADFDDMHMSNYINSNNVPITSDAIEMAVFHHSPNTGFILGSRRTSANASVNLMAGNTRYYPLVSSNDASGYHVLTKGTTGTALYYSNGVEQDSQAVTNQAMTGGTGNEIFLFTSSNGANTPYSGGYSNQRMAFSAIGLHLTPAQITADKATIEAYQTALSRL